MAETSAEKIVAQANEWNFQGDCSLLQWMKQISQNMEQRVSNTICALEQLNVNVKQTSTALDNTANSLTALQYTQFVESRCHDDDETNVNTIAGTMGTVNNNEEPQSSGVILKTFLNKNLEMLRNCHEKYTLDFEDSDEEDEANNCIYQPQNPYNERFLPHIFGSKLWKENWHVGLCNGPNDYSGDEASEAFSETSTTSPSAVEDNESYDSNTQGNLSEWASNTSLSNGRCPTTTAVMTVQNDSSQGGPHPLFPPISSFPADSDTSSTTSHTIPSRQQSNAHDLFATLHNTPPTSTSSSLSSSAAAMQQAPIPQLVHDKQSFSNAKNISTVPMFFDQIPEDDIFAGTTAASESGSTKTASRKTNYKPVNLFDDDGFNSFMSEIVEEPTPIAAARKPSISANASIAAPVGRKVVDLFDSPIHEAEQTEPKIIKPVVNLIERSEVSPTDEPLFPTAPQHSKNEKFGAKTKINVKSLFDDDVDDDFLNIFGSKNINIPKTNEKMLLFNDDEDEDDGNKNEQISTVSNRDLFGDDVQISKLTTAPATVVKNKIDLLAKSGDTLNENENEQINSEVENMQKDIENNLEDSCTVNNSVEESTNKAITTGLLYRSSEQGIYINKEDSINNEANNISDQNPGTGKNKLSKVKLTPNRSPLFEESDEFDDLFDNPKRHNSNKPLLNEREDVPIVIKKTDNQLKDFDVNAEKSYQNEKSYVEVTHVSEVGSEVDKYNLNDPDIKSSMEHSPLTTNDRDIFVESKSKVQDDIGFPSKPDSFGVSKNNETEKSLIKVPAAHSYSGLFLDEPPDDDFFQTLQSSGVKHSLDLEHDFYEPQTPNNTQTDGLDKTDTTAAANDYGGLCLFSDVPPDDDDHLNVVNDSGEPIKTSKSNQLDNIFYADFTEILERPGEISKLSQALFDEEPPPDVNTFDVLKQLIETVDSSALDNKVLQKQSSSPIKSIRAENPDIVVEEFTKIANSGEIITNISKLQMPNIDINVQALLPNVGGKPNLQRSAVKESHTYPKISEINILYPAYIEPIAHESKENILTNVCKTRVRAPAKRRPSTRRGRQENYRKSLLEEQKENLEELSKGDVTKKPNLQNKKYFITDDKRNQPTESGNLKQPNEDSPKYNENPNHSEIDLSTSINKKLSEPFPDNEEGDEFLFKPQPKTLKTLNLQNVSKDSLFLPTSVTPQEDYIFDEVNEVNNTFPKTKLSSVSLSSVLKPFENNDVSDLFEHTKNVSKLVKENEKSSSKATSLFTDEQNDSDDELFKSTNPSRTKTAQLPPLPSKNVIKVAASLFGSDEDSNDNDDFMNALRKGGHSKGAIKKPPTAKQEPLPGKNLFSDVESDDDGDLFGGASIKSTTKVASKSLQHPLSKQSQASASVSAPTTVPASMLENNPLADLLNS